MSKLKKISPLIMDDKRLRAHAEKYDLTASDFKRFYNIFAECDRDRGGSLDLDEFHRYIEERPSPFAERILYDTIGANKEKPITFGEFTAAVITYCTLTKIEIQKFVFDTIDADRSGMISKQEIEEMMTWLHRDLFSNVRVAIDSLDYDANGEVNWGKFRKFANNYPFLIFPAYRIQKTLRRKTFGERFWSNKDDLRTKKWNNKMRDELGLKKGWSLPKLGIGEKLKRIKNAIDPPQPSSRNHRLPDLRAGANQTSARETGRKSAREMVDVVRNMKNMNDFKKGLGEMRSRAVSMAQDYQNQASDIQTRYQEVQKNKEKEKPKEPDLAELMISASQPQTRRNSIEITEVQELRPGTTDIAEKRKQLEKKLRDYNTLLETVEMHDAEHELKRQHRIKQRNKLKKKKKQDAKKRAKERADRRVQNTVLFDPAKHVGVRHLVYKNEKKKEKKNNWFAEEDDSDFSDDDS